MKSFKLLSPHNYVTDVTASIEKAKQRIFIIGLVIAEDEATQELIEAIFRARTRGVTVNIAIDTFTFSEFGGFFSPLKYYHAKSRAASRLALRLKDAGVTFRWLGGNHKINPFAGVTHIKWTVVDNVVYSFGGVNLYKRGIENIDYMFKVIDEWLASKLVHEQQDIIKADKTPVSYLGARFTPKGTDPLGVVYVDSGDRGDSMIYNRACELATEATHVTFVSQYCPGGRLSKILRQRSALIYFNQPRNIKDIFTKVFVAFAQWRYSVCSLYHQKTYLHAKFILFEMESGEKISLTGSHNFSQLGVSFGTREVALESSDPDVYAQLEDFFQEYIPSRHS